MNILGISAFYHDSAAALLVKGEIVAAAQEERFSRKKHDAEFPIESISFCLAQAGLSANQIDQVVFYDKPFLKFERLLETYLSFAPRGFSSFRTAMPVWLSDKIFQKKIMQKELDALWPGADLGKKLLFSEHHLSHAASAFFPSPFEEALVLTMDGVGEWTTTSVAHGKGNELKILKEIHFPHSLGMLYSAFTYYTGFKVNSGEYKVMGLAPYGKPVFKDKILSVLMDVKPDGSFRLNQDYFGYCTGLRMTNSRFNELFGGAPRSPDEPLTQRHMDLAASVQAATEEVVLRLTNSLQQEYGISNLCLAGGVALNCVANGKIAKEGKFKKIWVQPAAGDAGGALGAALSAYHLHLNQPRKVSENSMKGAYLGPEFSQEQIEAALKKAGAIFSVYSETELLEKSALLLAEGRALGWFQGKMEFGPRALGARSILADPRRADTQKNLNLKVKYRESFRPFAPSILRERVGEWFEWEEDSPYMMMVAQVKGTHRKAIDDSNHRGLDKLNLVRSSIPAVTHVDFSARIQTVQRETNPKYHRLLSLFEQKTGCPILVNTSFNVRGEPIVCNPEDAFRCFMGTEIEAMAIGNCLLLKEEQDATLKRDYKKEFLPD